MTFRYIGSKARLIQAIAPHFDARRTRGRFVDMFCGTGAVAHAAASLGWPVLLNDTLSAAVTMAAARLVSVDRAPFREIGGYQAAIRLLNESEPARGVLWRKYSPASLADVGIERRYFTEANAAKLDGVRRKIAAWKSSRLILHSEETLLLGDLLFATNRVANIAGTYGCFLSTWQQQALAPVLLEERELFQHAVSIELSNQDAFDLRTSMGDIVYLDPPYTKRQYASYYHVLETIVLNDDPEVEGVCGLRPWKHKASPFCYKRKALDALATLVASIEASDILISYSDQGHIDLAALLQRLEPLGSVELVPLHVIGRYRPNSVASENGTVVTEYLVRVVKADPIEVRMAA